VLSSDLVEQLQRCLHTPVEDPDGEPAVGQPKGADHQAEDGERVDPSGLDVTRVEARGDVVDDAHDLLGEDVAGVGGSSSDLVEHGSGGAAVREMVAVFGRQVGTDEGLKYGPIRGFRLNALTLCAQLLGENVRDQILLRGEVGVEGAIRQAGVGHHRGQARAVDAVLLETPPGGFEDP